MMESEISQLYQHKQQSSKIVRNEALPSAVLVLSKRAWTMMSLQEIATQLTYASYFLCLLLLKTRIHRDLI